MRWIALLAALAVTVRASPLADALAFAPPLPAQADGSIILPAGAASVVRWYGNQISAVANTAAVLRVEQGAVTHWCGGGQAPAWRFTVPTAGLYRVIITRGAAPGEEGEADVLFGSRRPVRAVLGATPSGQAEAVECGDVELTAGVETLAIRPSVWISEERIGRLFDVRLIPVGPLRKAEAAAFGAMARAGVDRMPDVAELIAREQELRAPMSAWNMEVRRKDFSSFTNFDQFLAFDALRPKFAAREAELRQLGSELAALRRVKARTLPDTTKPADRALVEAYLAAHAAYTEAVNRRTVMPPGYPPTVPARDTLFATGRFEELPEQAVDAKAKRVELSIQPPPDAAVRRAAFVVRNEPAGLAELARQLQRVLVPGTPGLETFEREAAAGRAREALEAYRAYFFAKLKQPERFGAVTENIFYELARDRGRGELLRRPVPFVLEQNLVGRAVVSIRGDTCVGRIGEPGEAAWVAFGLEVPAAAANDGRSKKHPFWQTPEGRAAAQKLEFFRCLNALPADRDEYYGGGLVPALLWSYALGGETAHLRRWCDYADDWAMNAARDQDAMPFGVRDAVELETQFVRATLNLFRIVLDERPEFARDFDAATLARLMLKFDTDFTPYLIRTRRAQMANWGIMGLAHQSHLSRFLHELRGMQRYNHENWRLWIANTVQHRTPDAENIEAWDNGHNWIDIGFADDAIPFMRLPDGAPPQERTLFWDRIRNEQRRKLVHLSPDGNYWPTLEPDAWRNTLFENPQPDGDGTGHLTAIAEEHGARSRIEAIRRAAGVVTVPPPDRRSDFSPIAGMAYLREGWGTDRDYVILQNIRKRSQSQADCSRTMYSLSRNERVLVEAHGLVVDRKPDNRFFGVKRTGGKTDYAMQADRAADGDRFHTSDRFDFAEARQDAPYAIHRMAYRDDVYGLYRTALEQDDPEAITNVVVTRQVFGVQGERLWIVCDRIENRSDVPREYTQFLTFPIRAGREGFAERINLLASGPSPVQVDETNALIRTASPGFENVTMQLIAPAPLTFASKLDGKRQHERQTKSPLAAVQQALKSGKSADALARQPILQPVSARWTAAGNQCLVTVLATRPAVDATGEVGAGGPRTIARMSNGCHVVTHTGAAVWFQSGPAAVNDLACGPIRARGEALLAVRETNGALACVALGCRELTVEGTTLRLPAADFEMRRQTDGRTVFTPIHRAVGMPVFEPQRSGFIDHMDVAIALPGDEAGAFDLRYTLDGSDPTIASPAYAKPIRLTETTLVKVRTFRKGLKTTPWTYDGIESGVQVGAVFRKLDVLPAVAARPAKSGVACAYFEDRWPRLFAYAGEPGVLVPASTGTVSRLLDARDLAAVRKSDRAFAVRYEGFLTVPRAGVYTFHAPANWLSATGDAGFDLRVLVDGREWSPNPDYHAEHQWDVALAAGPHRFIVAYTDYRWTPFRNDYWMAWQPEQMGAGVPVLDVSGPGLERQSVPDAWLMQE